MKIGKTLYVKDRGEWRKWLSKNHDKASEIWFITYKKHTGKPTISYNDAVEEALCFGWIDSIVKRLDEDRTAQRYTPRKAKSNLSALNRERVLNLIKQRKMTDAGLTIIKDQMEVKFEIPKDILQELKKNKRVWANFQKFPDWYVRIRISFIEGARTRPEMFEQRLNYFIKKTAENKRFGMMK